MSWWTKEQKVEPVPKTDVFVEAVKAQLAALPKDPNVVYVFWWERSLNPAHIECIRRLAHGNGLNVVLVAGTPVPEIYKLQKGE